MVAAALKRQVEHFDPEIEAQIVWLEEEISSELGNLRVASLELQNLENELEAFLSQYYNEVGGIFEEMSRVDKQLKTLKQKVSGEKSVEHLAGNADAQTDTEPLNFSFHSKTTSDFVNDETTRLYRKLTKNCHPEEMASNPEVVRTFELLQLSYEHKDLKTMVGIEQMLIRNQDKKEAGETSAETLARLEQYYQSVLNMLDQVKLRKHELIHSSAYKLQQKVIWQQLMGEDLVERIKETSKNKLGRKKALLAHRQEMLHQGVKVRQTEAA